MKQTIAMRRRIVRLHAALAMPCGFGPTVSVSGQGIAQSSPSQLGTPDAFQKIDAERSDASLDPTSPFYLKPNTFLGWGPVTARPHLDTTYSYGNNIRSRAGANANTVMEQVSPGSLFELGSKWRLEYTPTLSFYSSKQFQDTLAHRVHLLGGAAYGEWYFGLSQSYQATSQPLIETGRQTDQETFDTALSANRHFNSKLLLELSLDQSYRDAQAYSSSRSWSSMDWLNYQVAPRVSIAAGLGGGYQNVDKSPDMIFEQIQGRLNVHIAEKINLVLSGGGEIRQILVAGADNLINPIYSASILYHPFEQTTLSLSGSRTVQASLLQGYITEATGISLAVNQRLLGVLHMTLSGGFRNTQYLRSFGSLALDRQDDTTTFSARLSYGFVKRGTIAIFYDYHDNNSASTIAGFALGGFGYTGSQVGLNLSYRF